MAPTDPRLRREVRAFLMAVQFLTIWPVSLDGRPQAAEQGRSTLYYPLVGLLIGGGLAVLAAAAGTWFPATTVAAVLLVAWVIATGALHLDGLADAADGWLGGQGERARTLRIMQDPHTGAAGAVAVVLLLITKFAALSIVLGTAYWWLLLFVPVLARVGVVALLLTTPYARPGGMAASVVPGMPRQAARVVVGAALGGITLIAAWSAGIVLGVLMVLLPALALWGWRGLMMRRLGGTTGDTAGAAIEAMEALALLALTAAV